MALENTETKPVPAGEAGADDPTILTEERHKRRRSRRHRPLLHRITRRVKRLARLRIIIATVIVLVTLPTLGIIVFAVDANARVVDALSNLRRTLNTINRRSITQLTLNDFARMQASLSNFTGSLAYARQNTVILQKLDFLSSELKTTFAMLDAAEELSQASIDMLNGLQPALFYLVEGRSDATVGADISSGERVVELLELGQSRFDSAARRLANAGRFLDNVQGVELSSHLLSQVQELGEFYQAVKVANQLLQKAPRILSSIFGLDEPIDYLILSQNSDELRPSGGYISTYGWMRVRRFRITDYGYAASTAVSPNPPPEALVKDLNIPEWWLQYPKPIYTAWDGSWYADFPSTARMAAWFYNNGKNPRSPVDGVIGIDIKGFEYLLDGVGGVLVPDSTEPITSGNFREVIYKLRASNIPGDPYKEFLAMVYREIISSWQTLEQTRSQQMLESLFRALQEKHLMVYFEDQELDEIVSLLGWSGAQNQGNTGYLMIADTNMGNKSNSSVTRAITQDVQIESDGTTQNRLTLMYDYPATVADLDPAVRPEHYGDQKDYINLMQVYVPKGSTLVSSDNITDTIKNGEVLNRRTFVAFVRVNYDTKERFQITYRTPVVVEQYGTHKRYRLLLQKQPGTPGDDANIQITMPDGAQIISVTPEPITSYSLDRRILEFKVKLVTDQWVDIIFD